MSNSILDLPFVGITRRNHALEHATLHMLAAKYPMKMMGGHSNPTGYFIVGDVSTEDIAEAASKALGRLRDGESALAIHPGCGTNLATSMLLGASFAWFVMRGARSTSGRLLRLPFAFGFALLGLAISRPLGPLLQQKITTDADVGDLRVVEVRVSTRGPVPTHRVMTRE
ncbi:MAG: DUF6391 domain-containing protein [Anaerolineales bacterium]|jgi:hypothetical protein